MINNKKFGIERLGTSKLEATERKRINDRPSNNSIAAYFSTNNPMTIPHQEFHIPTFGKYCKTRL